MGALCCWDTYRPGSRGLCRPVGASGQAAGSSGLASLAAAPEPWGICQTSGRGRRRSLSWGSSPLPSMTYRTLALPAAPAPRLPHTHPEGVLLGARPCPVGRE